MKRLLLAAATVLLYPAGPARAQPTSASWPVSPFYPYGPLQMGAPHGVPGPLDAGGNIPANQLANAGGGSVLTLGTITASGSSEGTAAQITACTTTINATTAGTATVTASVSGTVMTVTAQSGAPLLNGDAMADLTTNLAAGQVITNFGTGTGGTGTYSVRFSQTVASESMTGAGSAYPTGVQLSGSLSCNETVIDALSSTQYVYPATGQNILGLANDKPALIQPNAPVVFVQPAGGSNTWTTQP